jgi:hypothetical protein
VDLDFNAKTVVNGTELTIMMETDSCMLDPESKQYQALLLRIFTLFALKRLDEVMPKVITNLITTKQQS